MIKTTFTALTASLWFLLLPHHPVAADPLLLAGGSEIFLVDSAAAETGAAEKLWRWSGADAPDLPDDARRGFVHLDECKPVDGGKKLLLCASNGGCALLERETKKILWRAHVTNAHSVALLPRDRVVVASSKSGDHLVLFDLAQSLVPLFKTPLRTAHGVVWDTKRNCLWALGYDELQAYQLEQWESDKPSLKLSARYPLPSEDGHDLLLTPEGRELVITSDAAVHLFDCDQHTFRAHPLLGALSGIKSVDIHPATGRLVFSDWKSTLHLLSPEGKITFKDAQPYKARWLVVPAP